MNKNNNKLLKYNFSNSIEVNLFYKIVFLNVLFQENLRFEC